MKALSLLCALLGSRAYAFTEIAAGELTCEQVIKNVEAEKRYYLQTQLDGIIPIYVTIPVSKSPWCTGRNRVAYEVVVTRDNPECIVGYNCVSN